MNKIENGISRINKKRFGYNAVNLTVDVITRGRASMFAMSRFLLIVVAILFATNFSAKAQCIDATQIPAYYREYNGPFTEIFQVAPDCFVTYTYCYRCDCPKGADGKPDCSNGGFYDCYISSMAYNGTCSGINTGGGGSGSGENNPPFFDIALYNSLYGACLVDLVTRVNPWVNCGLTAMGGNIPPCPENSRVVYRAGRPSCTSDFYYVWENGKYWRKTAPCNVSGLGYYCFNTYTYCWEFDPKTGGYFLKPNLISTGAPGTWACPNSYIPEPPAIQTPVNCNSICGE